ncbi:hypothetical protein G5V59_20785 [Nocardioides sp. W3-2-3]|uniref:hypothetical protein n=1 Tax=Nocardioides convexus TaxID=2712224 RepID=UPI00241823F2|nr:hypothetical protein [Nocardioides convexus]NHA01438.1 hypothetical protein [Nocardioides convexus]
MPALTAREVEILALVAEGRSNGEIGKQALHQHQDGERARLQHPRQGSARPAGPRRRRSRAATISYRRRLSRLRSRRSVGLVTLEAERATARDGDTRDLTMRRFQKTSVVGGSGLPPVPLDALPPGPRWPALVQTIALMRFRHRFHPWLHRRYGDAYTVNLVPGGRPLVLFTRPEVTKEIFAGDPEVFHAGRGNAVLGPIMGEHSLLLQDSTEHHRARKAC